MSPSIATIMNYRLQWAGYATRRRASRNAFKILVQKSLANYPHGKPRRRWGDNIGRSDKV
jgi:hypothetical protein